MLILISLLIMLNYGPASPFSNLFTGPALPLHFNYAIYGPVLLVMIHRTSVYMCTVHRIHVLASGHFICLWSTGPHCLTIHRTSLYRSTVFCIHVLASGHSYSPVIHRPRPTLFNNSLDLCIHEYHPLYTRPCSLGTGIDLWLSGAYRLTYHNFFLYTRSVLFFVGWRC